MVCRLFPDGIAILEPETRPLLLVNMAPSHKSIRISLVYCWMSMAQASLVNLIAWLIILQFLLLPLLPWWRKCRRWDVMAPVIQKVETRRWQVPVRASTGRALNHWTEPKTVLDWTAWKIHSTSFEPRIEQNRFTWRPTLITGRLWRSSSGAF